MASALALLWFLCGLALSNASLPDDILAAMDLSVDPCSDFYRYLVLHDESYSSEKFVSVGACVGVSMSWF